MVVNLTVNAMTGRNKMDFKQAMREYGIAPETIMEDLEKMKLSEVIEAIPPRHPKSHSSVEFLTVGLICCGDITYGEYLERIKV